MLGYSRSVEIQAIALGKALERRIRDESVKPLKEVQPVKVRLGQSRSGQADSECCISTGDRRDEAYTARKQAARVSAPKSIVIANADAVSLAEGSTRTTATCEAARGRRSP